MNIDWLKKNWLILVLLLGVAYYFFVYKKQNTDKVDDVVDDNPVIGSGNDSDSGNKDTPTSGESPSDSPFVVVEEKPSDSPFVVVEEKPKPVPFVIDIPTLQLIKQGLHREPTISAFSQADRQSLFSGKKYRR